MKHSLTKTLSGIAGAAVLLICAASAQASVVATNTTYGIFNDDPFGTRPLTVSTHGIVQGRDWRRGAAWSRPSRSRSRMPRRGSGRKWKPGSATSPTPASRWMNKVNRSHSLGVIARESGRSSNR